MSNSGWNSITGYLYSVWICILNRVCCSGGHKWDYALCIVPFMPPEIMRSPIYGHQNNIPYSRNKWELMHFLMVYSLPLSQEQVLNSRSTLHMYEAASPNLQHYTVKCYYNTVQYIIVWCYINETETKAENQSDAGLTKDIPYLTCGGSDGNIFEKIDHLITALHCNWPDWGYYDMYMFCSLLIPCERNPPVFCYTKGQ